MPDVDILNLPTDTIFENVFNGDRYKHTFEDSSFEFGSEVYERDQPIKKDIVEDFEGDWGRLKQAFRVLSDLCRSQTGVNWIERMLPSIRSLKLQLLRRALMHTFTIPQKQCIY